MIIMWISKNKLFNYVTGQKISINNTLLPPKKNTSPRFNPCASSASPSPSNPPPPSVSDTAAVGPDPHQARPGRLKNMEKHTRFRFQKLNGFFRKQVLIYLEVVRSIYMYKYYQMSILWPYWWNMFRYCAFLQVNNNYQRTQPFP